MVVWSFLWFMWFLLRVMLEHSTDMGVSFYYLGNVQFYVNTRKMVKLALFMKNLVMVLVFNEWKDKKLCGY